MAAFAELITTFASKPTTLSAYFLILSPNGTNCSPNVEISFSPAKKPATPPVFGRLFASSAIAIAAFAELITTLASKPTTLSAYFLNRGPNSASSSAKVEISFSPAKNPATPPVLGILLANSAIAVAAFADASTTPPSIPLIDS